MFNGEESIRLRSELPRAKLEDAIEDACNRIGVVDFFDRGEFKVSGSKFKSFATDVTVDGQLARGRKEGEWTLLISYNVRPSALCWVIAVVGFLFCLIGPLVLLIPFLDKSKVDRAVERAVRDVQRDVEDADDRDS